MILDTTYLLPLIRIGVKKNLLAAIFEGKTKIDIGDISISDVTLLELIAKAAKVGIPTDDVIEGITAIKSSMKIISFQKPEVIRYSIELRKMFKDFIDCIIVATSIVDDKILVTEDHEIHAVKDKLKEAYGLKVISYDDIVA